MTSPKFKRKGIYWVQVLSEQEQGWVTLTGQAATQRFSSREADQFKGHWKQIEEKYLWHCTAKSCKSMVHNTAEVYHVMLLLWSCMSHSGAPNISRSFLRLMVVLFLPNFWCQHSEDESKNISKKSRFLWWRILCRPRLGEATLPKLCRINLMTS